MATSRIHSAYSHMSKEVDSNFKPLNVIVFKNGDTFSAGYEISVTRRLFPNWLTLLDFLTDKLQLVEGAVHCLYSVDGEEIRTFQDMENEGAYVAAHGKFRPAAYGHKLRPWRSNFKPSNNERPNAITSKESLEMYLIKRGYKPNVGDIWDDSQFDLKKLDLTEAGFSMVTKRAPSRTHSVDGNRSRAPSRRYYNGGRSKTEESMRSRNYNSIAQSITSRNDVLIGSTSFDQNRFSNANKKVASNRQRTFESRNTDIQRPTTATLSVAPSRAASRRNVPTEATQRAMQWNLRRSGRVSTLEPALLSRIEMEIEDADPFKAVNPALKKAYEDRAYNFYKDQQQLRLKQEIIDRAAKKKQPATKPLAMYEDFSANNSGTASFKSGTQVATVPTAHVDSNRPPLPYRFQTTVTAIPHHVPPLGRGKVQSHHKTVASNGTSTGQFTNVDSSRLWIEKFRAVEQLPGEVTSLSKRNMRYRDGDAVRRLYDSD